MCSILHDALHHKSLQSSSNLHFPLLTMLHLCADLIIQEGCITKGIECLYKVSQGAETCFICFDHSFDHSCQGVGGHVTTYISFSKLGCVSHNICQSKQKGKILSFPKKKKVLLFLMQISTFFFQKSVHIVATIVYFNMYCIDQSSSSDVMRNFVGREG